MKKIVLFDNFDKIEASKYAEQAAKYLLDLGHKCYLRKASFNRFSDKILSPHLVLIEDTDIANNIDFVITFGGDGTILSAVKQYVDADVPIMGFNVGKLGFLAEFSVKNLFEELDKLLYGDYKIKNRIIIETNYNDNTIMALNDFVIEKYRSSKMITLKAYSDDCYIGDYRGDGLIISTPTGSTAYSLSSGGPILHPNTNVFCLTPICPHSLTLRPLILPNNKKITIKVFSPNGKALMNADGHSQQIVKSGEILAFSLSQKRIRIIIPTDSTFYSVIRKKLLWGEYAFENEI